ncbi:MAG: thioredoxin [Candidatus Melainabacteria bacterium]|nr:thioredoxin [Candidatus Melainabacteria bacterium]
MQSVNEVNASNFDQIVLQSKVPVVVDFFATWCGPCRQLGPILEKLSTEVSAKALVVKVNADDSSDLAAKYNVSGLPTLLFFKDGVVVERHAGLMSLSNLKATIEKHSS